jgi:hypothetical protein
MRQFIYVLFVCYLAVSCNEDDAQQNIVENPIEFQNQLELIKTYGGSEEDDALSVVQTSDGHIAVLGFTQSNDGDVTGKVATDSDYWLLKLDNDLNLIWQKTFGGSSDDRGQSITTTSDGGFLISGYSRSNDGDVDQNFGFHDYWVLKLNASGDIIWQKSFGFSGNDRSYSAIQTLDGGFFITGFLDVSASNGMGNDDGVSGRPKNITQKHGVGEFWGIKLDQAGDIEWRRYFGGSNNDRSYDVVQADDTGMIMVGSSESNDFDISNPKGSYDFWALKLGLDGEMIWQKNFGGSGIDIGYAVEKSLGNTYYMTGDTRSSDGDVLDFKGNTDYFLVKFDENGSLIWQKTYGGSDFDSARSVLQLLSGDILITGSSRSDDLQVLENFGQNDLWMVHAQNSGSIISSASIGGSQMDLANDAVQLQSGEVIVVGSSESNDYDITENKGDKDLLVLKIK